VGRGQILGSLDGAWTVARRRTEVQLAPAGLSETNARLLQLDKPLRGVQWAAPTGSLLRRS
jgi:hypothetical protein